MSAGRASLAGIADLPVSIFPVGSYSLLKKKYSLFWPPVLLMGRKGYTQAPRGCARLDQKEGIKDIHT
jgi:hypothetical protein